MDATFAARKQQVLLALSRNEGDKSPKGSVDAPIVELVDFLNRHNGIYTTSSCSGRITVFAEPLKDAPGQRKRSGEWIYITHEPCVLKDVEAAIMERQSAGSRLVFRFEPFILHVECRSMDVAQRLMNVAKASGFRESGIMGGRRIVAAVRCSLRLEVPVSHGEEMLVPASYVRYLVQLANTKFAENHARVQRFQDMFQQLMLAAEPEAGGTLAPPQEEGDEEAADEWERHAAPTQTRAHQRAGPTVPAPSTPHRHPDGGGVGALADGTGTSGAAGTAAAPRTHRRPAERSAGGAPGIADGSVGGAVGPPGARRKGPGMETYTRKARRAQAAERKAAASSRPAGQGEGGDLPQELLQRQQALLRRQQALLAKLGAAEEQLARSVLCCGPNELAFLPTACCCSQGLRPEELLRWGHTTCLLGRRLLVFGGYGGTGAQSRRNDLIAYDVDLGMWAAVHAGAPAPPPRMGHAATAVGGDMVVIGGRASPEAPFDDVWLLQSEPCRWRRIATSTPPGDPPWQPRFRHSAVYHPPSRCIYVFGGKLRDQPLDELWALHVGRADTTWSWQQLRCSGDPPCARSSHAVALVGDCVYLFGGSASYSQIFGDLYRLHIPTKVWSWVAAGGDVPPPCFSHSLTPLPSSSAAAAVGPGGGVRLVLLGGYPVGSHQDVYVLDVELGMWRRLRACVPRQFAPIRHTATAVGDTIHVLGGGTFLYGSLFSPPHTLRLEASTAATAHPTTVPQRQHGDTANLGTAGTSHRTVGDLAAAAECREAGPMQAGAAQEEAGCSGGMQARPAQQSLSTQRCDDGAASGPSGTGSAVLCVDCIAAKGVKDALRAAGWLDRKLKAGRGQGEDGGRVTLPLTPQGAEQLQSIAHAVAQGASVDDASQTLVDALRHGLAELGRTHVASNPKIVRTPQEKLRDAAAQLLIAAGHSPEQVDRLCQELPSRWEKLGDVALIPHDAMTSGEWSALGAPVWAAVAEAMQVERVGRQAPIANTGTRDSQVELLHGASAGGWVHHREAGVTFVLDVTRCMFSSGNVTERTRIGRLDLRGQVLVDLFTGIGYYTLPALVMAGARKVYACEWNPHALEALRKGLQENGVSSRCEVLEGDCRQVAPREVADRVLLGLLPSAEMAWQTALEALKPEGGWLHVHHNVLDKEERSWMEGAMERLRSLAAAMGRHWLISLAHMERVKWYAPHIRHIVMDVRISLEPPARPLTQQATEDSGPPHPLQNQSQQAGAAGGSLPMHTSSYGAVRVLEGVTAQQFADEISPQREPVILRGLDLGPCTRLWSPSYLAASPSASTIVSAHVCHEPSGAMDFLTRNFQFRTMPLGELAQRCAQQPVILFLTYGSYLLPLIAAAAQPAAHPTWVFHGMAEGMEHGPERYYLRTVGANPRKERADFTTDFPDLAADVELPPLFPPDRAFSSVLRISSPGLRLWTHYDVMDNALVHVCGTKTVVLWPPGQEALLYMQGSSSAVTDIDSPDLLRFPRFAEARGLRCELLPGDVLFIPSLWFHNVLSQDFCISVNVFWRHLEDASLYERKDLYGNHDPLPASTADTAVGEALSQLQRLPPYYRTFYAARLARKLDQQLQQ